MKSDITIVEVHPVVEVHPQVSNHGHPVDGVLVGAGSPWPPPFSGSLRRVPNWGPKCPKLTLSGLTIPSSWLFF
jgi:hypothetical protein